MSDAPVPGLQTETSDFLQVWSDSFSQVVGQIAGAAFPFELRSGASPDLSAGAETDSWMIAACSGSLRGEMSLRIPAATALRLSQIFMSEPPAPEAALTPDHIEALVELLRQVAGIVSTSAKERRGEFQLLIEKSAAAPSWAPGVTYWLGAGDQGSPILLEFGLSAALVAQLRVEKTETPSTAPVPAESVSTAAAPDSTPGGTLDLLMDVQLAMTLRFGSRVLALREVLDLSPGTVIELDRKVQEPVDLLLDGKLIGRGEVVVIEGNFGLRVKEISPPANG